MMLWLELQLAVRHLLVRRAGGCGCRRRCPKGGGSRGSNTPYDGRDSVVGGAREGSFPDSERWQSSLEGGSGGAALEWCAGLGIAPLV